VRSLLSAGMLRVISTNESVSWETLFTADFELDVLRGKRPYRRTIWVSLYAMGHHHR
jgi:hypothetical protein